MDLNLDVLPRGPLKLNFGRASQKSDGFEFGRASQRSIERSEERRVGKEC